MYPYFKNEKGQFIVPYWDIVNLYFFDEKNIPAIVKQQPIKKIGEYTWCTYEGYGVLGLTNASNYLPAQKLAMTEQELQGLLNNNDLLTGLKTLTTNKGQPTPFYKRIVKVNTMLKKEAWTLHLFDPMQEFSEKGCVALFCTKKDGTEGYVQKNGQLGPLSKAVLFENERDAQANIQRSSMYTGLGKVQAVMLNVSVAGLGNMLINPNPYDDETDFANTSINTIDAYAQKKKIKDALKMASVEQLEEAYKVLSGKEWGEEVSPSTPKKRM